MVDLFSDALSEENLYSAMCNVTMNDELERLWKEPVIILLNFPNICLPGTSNTKHLR
jgi:hypothetical protein